jgi:hypothetical protein
VREDEAAATLQESLDLLLMLRAKKTPKVMLRAFSSTADITLKADRFLKYVELADVLKRQKDLAKERDTLTDDMRRFSRPGAQDQTQGR